MSIKLRLVLSYIAMLVIPSILIFIAAVIIFFTQIGDVIKRENMDSGLIRDLIRDTPRLYLEVENAAREHPEKLEDIQFLRELDTKASILNAGIAVKKGKEFIYVSSLAENWGVINRLYSYSGENTKSGKPVIMDGTPYSILPYTLNFTNGVPGEFYYIVNMVAINRFMTNYFVSLGYTILIIVVFTNALITYLVSRSITKPLAILRRGTEEIKQGNLEFAVKSPSRDEIGEVCGAFEEMRVKLKESIGLRLQVEENRRALVSNISHDLKTPITSIKGYVEGILDGVADTPEKMDRYIRTIYAKAADMDRLIDELTLFSKLDLKSLPFNFERTDIVKYLRDCCDDVQLDFESKGMNFFLETELESAFVAMDREKFKRVIMNIIDNSVKYSDRSDGSIIIRLRDAGDKVDVEISDNGRGIDKDDLPYIFDRFYRADHSRNTSAGGSGLGLSIAKQIVEGHGGTIKADSEPGKGTRMVITLKKLENSGMEASGNV